MAITSSAKKAIRASAKKRVFNLRRSKEMDRAVKEVRKLASAGKHKEANAKLADAYQAVDKAAKTDYIKDNAAARIKSRLAKFVAKAEQGAKKK